MTINEIRNHIKNVVAAEFERDSVDYYLHITDDGEIVDSVDKADCTFICHLSPEDYGMTTEEYQAAESPEAIYAHEEDGDPIFERIVADLYSQAKKYLDDQGDETE